MGTNQVLHCVMATAPKLPAPAAVRYLSFVFACGKACDKIVLLARMVESDPGLQKSSQQTSRFPWHMWQYQKASLSDAGEAKTS